MIDNDTVLVVADAALKKQLCQGGCDWKTIQRKAVSIRRNKAQKLGLKFLIDEIYDWDLGYDDFLGVMRGILPNQQSQASPQKNTKG